MSRRRAFWVALAVGLAAIAALSAAGRLRQRSHRPVEPVDAGLPDPGPVAVGATAPSRPVEPLMASTTAPQQRTDTQEQPLPTWIRATIIGLALLAFLAVSLIATKNV